MTRSIWKGPFVHPSLLKKIDKLKDKPNKISKTKNKYYYKTIPRFSYRFTSSTYGSSYPGKWRI